MVHALEITHSLLKRDGLLIDIHPSGKPPPVEVHVDGKALLAGYMQETDDFVEYFEADSALAEVTARKLFDLERDGLFPFMTHHPTITALTNYLEAEWSDAILPDDVVEQIEALMAEPGKSKEIVVREIVRISRYRVSSR